MFDINRRLIALLFLVLITTTVSSGASDELSYQGYLTDPAGAPLDSELNMTFALYAVEAGGAPLWMDTLSVDVVQGLFSVKLGGAANPFTEGLFDTPLYLGIRVEFDPEMTPRRKLSSVPFAMTANSVSDPVLDAIKKRAKHDYSYLIDNGDETVSDPISGLMWNQFQIGPVNWYEASGTFDATYNPITTDVCGALAAGGHSDWRLPSPYEYQTLLPDFGVIIPPSFSVIIDFSLFPPSSPFKTQRLWTTYSELPSRPGNAVVMDVTDSDIGGGSDLDGLYISGGPNQFISKADDYSTLCVR